MEWVRSQGNGGKRFYLLFLLSFKNFFFLVHQDFLSHEISENVNFHKEILFCQNNDACMTRPYIFFSIRLASKNVPSPGSPCHQLQGQTCIGSKDGMHGPLYPNIYIYIYISVYKYVSQRIQMECLASSLPRTLLKWKIKDHWTINMKQFSKIAFYVFGVYNFICN